MKKNPTDAIDFYFLILNWKIEKQLLLNVVNFQCRNVSVTGFRVLASELVVVVTSNIPTFLPHFPNKLPKMFSPRIPILPQLLPTHTTSTLYTRFKRRR